MICMVFSISCKLCCGGRTGGWCGERGAGRAKRGGSGCEEAQFRRCWTAVLEEWQDCFGVSRMGNFRRTSVH